ncbi:hypothetical protein [Trebonia sp.]|uniref:Cas10/Cmr2 second palm domain-containing protein n=1 Tax=Trebonia sp. TaxID=2767075 RepID=UPI00262C37BF|nr:hypothetical protein [Trebonia sp.]
MAKKKGKSGQAARARQQQDAQARRRVPGAATGQRQGATAHDQGGTRAAAAQATPSSAGQASAQNHYLDVSVIRIQDWLARTPDLRFRRGASVLLTEATARDEVEKALPPGTRWNEEAGDVDGVVSLVVDGGEQAALDAAREVTRKIQDLMPHCQVQAVHGRGSAYAAAYEAMEKARRDGRLLADEPPAPPEVILAKPCDQCRSAAAVHPEIVIVRDKDPRERDPDLCEECYQRHLSAKGTKGDHRPPLPERRMKAALEDIGVHVEGFSDDFADMAAAGRKRGDDSLSQLALIFADGNRVGAFLHEALADRSGTIDKSDIVRVIRDATIGALAEAVRNRFGNWKRPPVLANIAGGDDLLISVPAADAWLFTRTLLDQFGRRVNGASGQWPGIGNRPTLSAGLVFHHLKHPFSDTVRLAEDELGKAKRWVRGTEAVVSFLDLTADGGAVDREPVLLSYLTDHAGELACVEQCPQSRRQALLTLLRQEAYDDVIRRIGDFADNQPLWDVIVGLKKQGKATPDEARQALRDDLGKPGELRRLLDIARHYTERPRRESPRDPADRGETP